MRFLRQKIDLKTINVENTPVDVPVVKLWVNRLYLIAASISNDHLRLNRQLRLRIKPDQPRETPAVLLQELLDRQTSVSAFTHVIDR